MYQIRWKNANPYCWQVSTDNGKTWFNLKADNYEDSSEAIEEAAARYGMATDKWILLDD